MYLNARVMIEKSGDKVFQKIFKKEDDDEKWIELENSPPNRKKIMEAIGRTLYKQKMMERKHGNSSDT